MSTVDKTTIPDVLCEFFDVAINNILYARKLYPESTFEGRRKYGVVVYQCIHPQVIDYISSALKAVNFHLKKNQLRQVLVCFQCGGKIINKYFFDLLNVNNNLESDPFLVKLEQNLRDFLVKLHTSNYYLENLPDDATFTICLKVTEYSNVEYNQNPENEDFPWIHVDDKFSVLQSPEIIPLQTIETDVFTVQMCVEKQSVF